MRQQCLLGRRQQSGCMWSHCGQLCRSQFPIADLFPMGGLEARLARSLDRYRALSPGTAPSNVTTARQEITWISCGYMSPTDRKCRNLAQPIPSRYGLWAGFIHFWSECLSRAKPRARAEAFPGQETATIARDRLTRRALLASPKLVHNRVHFDALGAVRAAEMLGSGYGLVG